MVSSVNWDSVSECPCLLTLLLDLPTVNVQVFYGFLCKICVMYISGVFVLVIFDSLLKEIWNNVSTLRE